MGAVFVPKSNDGHGIIHTLWLYHAEELITDTAQSDGFKVLFHYCCRSERHKKMLSGGMSPHRDGNIIGSTYALHRFQSCRICLYTAFRVRFYWTYNADRSNGLPELHTTQTQASELRRGVAPTVTEGPLASLYKLIPRGHQTGN